MEEEELPLPGSRGAYNIDFDNLDDINPFQSNVKMGSSPPRTDKSNPADNIHDPFQSRSKLRSSPPLSDCNENQIKSENEDPVNENSELVDTEIKNQSCQGMKNPRSPEGSEVNADPMEMSDSSPQNESPKKAPRYLLFSRGTCISDGLKSTCNKINSHPGQLVPWNRGKSSPEV